MRLPCPTCGKSICDNPQHTIDTDRIDDPGGDMGPMLLVVLAFLAIAITVLSVMLGRL